MLLACGTELSTVRSVDNRGRARWFRMTVWALLSFLRTIKFLEDLSEVWVAWESRTSKCLSLGLELPFLLILSYRFNYIHPGRRCRQSQIVTVCNRLAYSITTTKEVLSNGVIILLSGQSPNFPFPISPCLAAVIAKPLIWQRFFHDALPVKPFPFAQPVFTHDHLSK